MMQEASPQPVPLDEFVRTKFEGDPSRFSEIKTVQDVEQVAYEVLDSISEGQELMERIKSARNSGHEDAQAVHERGILWRQIAVEVSMVTGVEIEAADHEGQRETYRNNLRTVLSEIDSKASDEDIMLRLGIIRPAEGAKGHVFTFPSRIFPPYIKEQWTTYGGMIEQFKDAEHKLQRGIITQTDFSAIDALRTRAHNTLSASIGEIFQFSEWELEDYRRLVAKMADEKFAEPTGEMATYARLLRDRVIVPEHLTTLHAKLAKHKGQKV